MRRFLLFTLALSVSVVSAHASGWIPFGFERRGLPFVPVKTYVLQEGDTVTSVARDAGLTVETILSYNRIPSPRRLRAGQPLALPSRDGVLVSLQEPRSISSLAQEYSVYPDLIRLANGWSDDTQEATGDVFVPGAKIDPEDLRQSLGGYFGWPVNGGRITSWFGRRDDPFTGLASTHSGVDIAIAWGSPVMAAGAGVVTATGYSSILGNYIQINQGRGYVVVYGHLSAILTKAGKRVKPGQVIGKVGSTGYSTGPHLHFTAYRYNRLLDPMNLFS